MFEKKKKDWSKKLLMSRCTIFRNWRGAMINIIIITMIIIFNSEILDRFEKKRKKEDSQKKRAIVFYFQT